MIAFKRHLASQKGERSGAAFSKSTLLSTLNHLKAFFKWLACQPGYKQKIHLPDITYFSLSEKEARIAREPKYRAVPTPEQIRHVLAVKVLAQHFTKVDAQDKFGNNGFSIKAADQRTGFVAAAV